MSIDIIIFAVIAIFLGLRLYQVLGSKTGFEDESKGAAWSKHLSAKTDETAAAQSPVGGKVDVTVGDDSGHPLNQLSKTLSEIKRRDQSFSEGHFLRGARGAFDIIVSAYAKGDKDTLKKLLDPALYGQFESGIDQRWERGEVMESTIVRLRDPDISAAEISGDNILLSVSFKSEQISATRDKSGKVIDGDPDRIYDIVDIWTFRRNLNSASTNWYLAATKSGDH